MGTAPDPAGDGNAVRVLVADDDPWIRESFGFVLRDAGYEVQEAEDGQATLDTLLHSPHPLVVLLDLLMPEMTGFEILRHVAQDEILQLRHAYIVCSAQATTPERVGQHFVDLLARLEIPFIARPCDLDVLLRAVAAAAERIHPSSGGAGGQSELA